MAEFKNAWLRLFIKGMNSHFSQLIVCPDRLLKDVMNFRRLGTDSSGSDKQINKSSAYRFNRLHHQTSPNFTPWIPGWPLITVEIWLLNFVARTSVFRNGIALPSSVKTWNWPLCFFQSLAGKRRLCSTFSSPKPHCTHVAATSSRACSSEK